MMIDINADEFAELARPSQLPEIRHKPGWESSKTNDGTVDVHHERRGAIYLSASGETNIYEDSTRYVARIART